MSDFSCCTIEPVYGIFLDRSRLRDGRKDRGCRHGAGCCRPGRTRSRGARAIRATEKTSIQKAFEAGALLVEAKATCPHGEWADFLKRAHVHDRQARPLMQLARSGLTSDTVSELGGVKATLAWLATRKLPGENEVLIGTRDGVNTTLV